MNRNIFGSSAGPLTNASSGNNADQQNRNTSHMFPTTALGNAQSNTLNPVFSDLRTPPQLPENSNHQGNGIYLTMEILTQDINITSQLSSSRTKSDTRASRIAPPCMQSDHSLPSGLINSIAVTNSAAVQHSPKSFQGAGNQRFPPGRPPSSDDSSTIAATGPHLSGVRSISGQNWTNRLAPRPNAVSMNKRERTIHAKHRSARMPQQHFFGSVLSKSHPRKAIRWIHQRSESPFSTLNMR
jgi:hypothetical protein